MAFGIRCGGSAPGVLTKQQECQAQFYLCAGNGLRRQKNAAAIYTCHVDKIDFLKYRVLLNWCDNKSTTYCYLFIHRCKSSMIGQKLGCVFVGLLMSTDLGFQAEWLSTKLNVFADDISRLQLENEEGNYEYSQLLFDHPSLK